MTEGLIKSGVYIEVVTLNELNTLDGTALFKIEGMYAPSNSGVVLEVMAKGASSSARSIEFGIGFERSSPSRVVLHLCTAGRGLCEQNNLPGRAILHVDVARIRQLNSLTDSWIRLAPKEQQAYGGVDAQVDVMAAKVESLKEKLREKREETHHDCLVGAIKPKKKDRRRGRRRRKPDVDKFSSSSESVGATSLFHGGSSGSKRSIRDVALDCPGALYEAGLREVAKQMGSEGSGPTDLQQVRMVPYLTNRLLPKRPKIDTRVSRELRTHCEALDYLRDGQPARCADLLMQRTKALETSATEGWKFASRQEIVREEEGFTSLEERLATARVELEHAKLQGMRRSSSRGRGG